MSIFLAGAFVCIPLVSWLVGGALTAPAQATVGRAPASLEAEDVTFPSLSGSLIHGWYSRGLAGKGAVLLLHGVRGNRRDMLSRAGSLRASGYSILLIDLQAHGESTGARISFGLRESHDVSAAIAFLRQRTRGGRIGVIGVSLGAASFVLAQPHPKVDAVVLESMYPTLRQAISDRLRLHLGPMGPWLAPLLTLQFRPRLGVGVDALRPIDRLGGIDAPLLIVSGTLDRHTPIDETRALFAAAREPKDLWEVDGAAHVDLHLFAKRDYERRIQAFMGHWLSRQGTP